MQEWQQKLAGWRDTKVNYPWKLWHDTVGKVPLIESSVLGLAGYGLGNYGSKLVTRPVFNALMAGKTERQKQLAWEKMQRDGSLSQIRGIMGAGTGLALAALPLIGKGDRDNFFKSIVTPDYWDQPDKAKELRAKIDKARDEEAAETKDYVAATGGHQSFQEEEGGDDYRNTIYNTASEKPLESWQEKLAFFDTGNEHSSIPVGDAIDYFKKDNYLAPWEKQMGATVVQQAAGNKNRGLISEGDLIRTVTGLGAGYLAGQAFGKTVGAMFNLPKPVTEELSNKGGWAAAVTNTGIFRSLIK